MNMEFNKYVETSNKKLGERLDIKLFELDNYKNKKCRKFSHFALDSIIDKYNNLGEENSKKEGIYHLKHKNILLTNVAEEIMNNYIDYRVLFDGLIKSENNCFQKFNNYLEGRSHKDFSFNNNTLMNSHIFCKSDEKKKVQNILMNNKHFSNNESNCQNQKMKYKLKYPSFSLNGILFEEEAETFFKFFNEKYDDKNTDKKEFDFLPRIIFYKKQFNENEDSMNKNGYNFISCSFILKEKEEIKANNGITWLENLDKINKFSFFNSDDYENLTGRNYQKKFLGNLGNIWVIWVIFG